MEADKHTQRMGYRLDAPAKESRFLHLRLTLLRSLHADDWIPSHPLLAPSLLAREHRPEDIRHSLSMLVTPS